MKWLKTLLLIVVTCWLSAFSVYAQNNFATGDHIEVALVAEYEQFATNQINWIGVLLTPEEYWHTYWRNPGDSGESPNLEWSASAQLTFGDIQWPIPQQIPVAHLVNYGYESSVLLMVPVGPQEENLAFQNARLCQLALVSMNAM